MAGWTTPGSKQIWKGDLGCTGLLFGDSINIDGVNDPFVLKSGDTMTGDLTMNANKIRFNDSGFQADIEKGTNNNLNISCLNDVVITGNNIFVTSLVSGEIKFKQGVTNGDVILSFGEGATNEGFLTWKEDEDEFEFADTVNILGDLRVANKIIHDGDADTFIAMTPDQVNVTVGGVSAVNFNEAILDILDINPGQADFDTKIRSVNNDVMFYLNAGGDTVGIGTAAPKATLDVNGSFGANVVAKTANYIATIDDHTIICGAGNQTFTVTLPAAVVSIGRIYNIKNIGTGTITVDGASSETIDGATTQVISTQFDSITIQCDGTEWWII